jgi:hypothetical protein
VATLLQLRTAVRTKTGLPSSDTLVTDANLTDIINEANHTLENEADWPWLEAVETVAVSAAGLNFTPAATYLRTVSIRKDTDDHPLVQWDIEQLDRLSNASGPPQWYGFYAGKVEFRPKATGSFSLIHRYLRFEPELSGDTDVPLSPTVWHRLIVEYAACLVWRRVGEPDKAAQALAAFQGGGISGDKA